MAYRGSAVHSVALLPISARKSCASSARGPSVSTATIIIILPSVAYDPEGFQKLDRLQKNIIIIIIVIIKRGD